MRWLHAWELYERIPMKNVSILPAEGFGWRLVTLTKNQKNPDVTLLVRCLPKPEPGKRWGHRVRVMCLCGREIPFGRMNQHWPACQRKLGEKAA